MEIPVFNVFQFALIGTVVGFLGGFLGVGGGALMIPLLNYWMFPSMNVSPEVIAHLCFGTSLAIIIPTSLFGVLGPYPGGEYRLAYRLSFGRSGYPRVFPGLNLCNLFKRLSAPDSFWDHFDPPVSANVLQRKGLEESEEHPSPRTFLVLIVGFLVGLFSGFFGLGGGVVAIPLIVRVLKIPIHKAVGISLAFVLFASLVGTAGYVIHGWGDPNLPPYTLGYVHTLGWVLAGIPSIFLSHWGVRWAQKTRPLRLRRFFALILMVVGVRMVF